jgi:hypothetical protein
MPCRPAFAAVLATLAAYGAPDDRAIVLADQPVAASARVAETAAGPLDACAVLTKEDVVAVTGEEPRTPKPAEAKPQLPGSDMEGSTCQYVTKGWRLRFFVERGHDKSSKELLRTTLKGWQRVPGLGEEAYWGQSDPNKPGTMTLFEGSHGLVLNWFVRGGTAGPGTLEKSTELMRRALKRL